MPYLVIQDDIIMGKILIQFTCYSDQTNLDFCGYQITSLKVNDDYWSQEDIVKNWKKHQLSINTIIGENCILITFCVKFSENKFGIIKYTQNSSIYITSLFCPNYCHSCFPCFDQPDIKAQIKLQLKCPKEWLAISNMNSTLIEPFSESQNKWHFAITPKISVYLFRLNMGEWKMIPTTLISVNQLLFKIVLKKDLNIMYNYLVFHFHFKNMIQYFVPFISKEWNILELFYYLKILFKINQILGNQQSKSQSLKQLKFDDPKIHYLLYKQNGIDLDININSHPIEMNIEDANQGLQAFDSITYNKGSSVLQALVKLIGFNDFIDIIRHYLNKFKWANATTDDLFDLIQQNTQNVDNTRWKRLFIQQNGINLIEIIQQVQQSILKQSSISGNSIRQHLINVLLIKDNEKMESKSIMMTKDQHYLWKFNEYSAAILNYSGDSYCISTFDDRSLSYLLLNFNKLELTIQIRISIINNLFQMACLLGTFQVKLFMDFILQAMNSNIDTEVLDFMIDTLGTVFMNLNVEQQSGFGPIIFDKLYLLKHKLFNSKQQYTIKSEQGFYKNIQQLYITITKRNLSLKTRLINCFFKNICLIRIISKNMNQFGILSNKEIQIYLNLRIFQLFT
ncbi:unnamed protein product [Paramecium sonneborni]|uniref:Uncharacterized protein n=1 Tax=Paramecium sonneborni TaxID=65129 RepID=A0A8S1RFF1_9CILI|nr:unnamed protein product [Paramecium sonneborni]